MNEEISIESEPVDVQGWNSQDMKPVLETELVTHIDTKVAILVNIKTLNDTTFLDVFCSGEH